MNLNRPRPGPARRDRSRRLGFEALDRRELPSGFAASTVNVGPARHHHGIDRVDRSASPDGRVISGITYTRHGSHDERLDLYLPAGTPPPGGWPIILAFPGGGWRWADRKAYGKEVSVFTQYGYAVAGVDYTYASANGGQSWPTNLEDGQAAVRWAREHADRYYLNPNEVVAMGDSAGAHLALLLGTYPDGPVATDAPPTAPSDSSTVPGISSRPDAVVDFYGPTDLTALYNDGRAEAQSYFDTFLGGPPSEYPGRYAAASPVTYVKAGDPPILIVQGMKDRTNIPSQSLALDAALTKAGVPHRLITISWADHGFGLDLAGRSFVPDILSFFKTIR